MVSLLLDIIYFQRTNNWDGYIESIRKKRKGLHYR